MMSQTAEQIPVVYENSPGRTEDSLQKQMRKVGFELTVMSTVLADVRVNPYDYEKIAFQFPVPVIRRATTGDGPQYGTISRITQIVAEIKKTPEPCADLALHALEEHWDRLLISADPLSIRHRYHTGILAHMWSVLKVLRYVFQSSPIQAMADIVCQLQQERALSDPAITGVECASAIHPVSIDYLEDIIRKTKIAMDYPLEEPCHSNCVLGAVFFEIGKLVSEKDKVDPNTFGADCLVQSAKSVGVPYAHVVSVHEMVAVDPNPNGSYPYLPDAWIVMFARYLADTIG